jgi:hypothetical protein
MFYTLIKYSKLDCLRLALRNECITKEIKNYSEGGPLKLERSNSTTYPVTSLFRNTDITGDSLIFSKKEDLVKVLSKCTAQTQQ